MNVFARRLFASLTCTALIAGAPLSFADDKPGAKPEAAAEKGEKKAGKQEEERRGPIPALYGKLVAPDQKEKIYAIQEKYKAEMAPLVAKMKEIQAAQTKEIEAVLTPEQLAKLQAMRAEQAKAAMAKREQMKKTEGDKPAGEKSAEAKKPAEAAKPAEEKKVDAGK